MSRNVAYDLNSLGYGYFLVGELGKAEECFRQSLEIYQRLFGKDYPQLASVQYALGLVLANRSDNGGALGAFFEAQRIAALPENASNPVYSACRASVAFLHAELGLSWIAEAEFADCLEAEKKLRGDQTFEIGYLLDGLGHAQGRIGKSKEAIGTLRSAASIYRKRVGAHHPLVARVSRSIAEFHGDLGQYDQAIGALDESLNALSVVERMPPFGKLTAMDLKPEAQAVTILRNRGYWLLRKAGDKDDIELLRESERSFALAEAVQERLRREFLETEASKLDFASSQYGMYSSHIVVLGRLSAREGSAERMEAAFLAAERGTARVLVEQMGQGHARVLGRLKGEYAQEEEAIKQALREIDARIAHEEAKSVDQYDPAETARLSRQRERIEEQRKAHVAGVERDSPRYAALNYPSPCSLAEARACLAPNEVALLFAVGWADTPAAVILIEPQGASPSGREGGSITVLPVGRQELEELVDVLCDQRTLQMPERARAWEGSVRHAA